jgi:phosphoenolpyruvate synthase/pyruvate phosphate dikinase
VEDVSTLSEEQVIALARYFAAENAPRGLIPLIASGPALPALAALLWLLRRLQREDLYLPLISGVGRNPTVETALAMWDLAEGAGAEVRAAFAGAPIERVPQALAASAAGREFLARMDEFLRIHGHRAVREFDFSCPRWREDPTFVYESVRNYLSHPAGQPTPRQHYQRQVEEHERAKQELDRALRHRPLRRWICRRLVKVIEDRMPLREAFKDALLYGLAHVRDLLLEVGRRQVARGVLEKADDFLFLSIPEAEKIATGELDAAWVRQQIPIRRREFAGYMRMDPPLVVRSDGKPVMKPAAAGEVLMGAAASPGVARGPARILFDPADGALLQRGDILVAKFTDPGWTPLFLTAGGLVMEVGGIVSHGAVVAREYGLPAVIGVKYATRILRDGEILEVDGTAGEVRRESEKSEVRNKKQEQE